MQLAVLKFYSYISSQNQLKTQFMILDVFENPGSRFEIQVSRLSCKIHAKAFFSGIRDKTLKEAMKHLYRQYFELFEVLNTC